METSHEVNASARNDSAESPVNKDAIRRIVLIVLSAFLFFGIAGIFSKNYLFNRHVQYVAGGSDVTEVKVLGVVMDSLSGSPAVFLHHESEDVYLPIWIGANEAVAIQAELSGVKSPRPLTNDLLKTVIEALDATLEKIIINKVKNDTYYALLSITAHGNSAEIDARPSDAIGLAIRFKCPIFVSNDVLKEYGVTSGDAAKKRSEKSRKI